MHTAGTAAEARRLLKAAITTSREHFRMEEKVVFPLLERVLLPETLVQFARSFLANCGVPEPATAHFSPPASGSDA